jgi:hypothetical protein
MEEFGRSKIAWLKKFLELLNAAKPQTES